MICARPFSTFAPGGQLDGNRAYDAVPNARLVAWYDVVNSTIIPGTLNNGVDTFTDVSGNINTLKGISPNRPPIVGNNFGAFQKNGLYFERVGVSTDWLTAPTKVFCPLGYTVFITFKFDATDAAGTTVTTTGNVPLTMVGDTSSNFVNAFGLSGGNVSYSYKVGTFGAVTSSGLTLADGNIHTIAVTHDAATAQVKLYSDGVLRVTSTKTYDPAATGYNTLGTGNAHTDQYWGAFAECLVWNDALDEDAVKKMHTRAQGLWF